MISKPQVGLCIYGAFYSVIRVGQPPTMAAFYKSTVQSTWPQSPAPADYPDFWWDAVALEMQKNFISYTAYLNGLDGAWLKQHINDTWQVVLTYAQDNVEALKDIL